MEEEEAELARIRRGAADDEEDYQQDQYEEDDGKLETVGEGNETN